MKVKVCGECGVPLAVSRGQVWHSNGVITQARDPDRRMIFHESDNIDDLFRIIEEIIGLPIEHIVIESKRREVREYVEKLLPWPVRKVARYMGFKPMARMLSRMGRAYGYGDVSLGEQRIRRRDDDYQTMIVRNPHSLLFYCGENLGAWEAIDGRDSFVEYEKIGDKTYRVTNRIGKHPIELQERLQKKRYSFKPGNIQFERCPGCSIPLGVTRYRWDLVEGTIVDPVTNNRMAILGPSGFEAVLDDLEAELGETVPEAIIEAYRRNLREHLAKLGWLNKKPTDFRQMLALRGLGNITRFDHGEERLDLTVENSCIPLLMVGLAQAIFELAWGLEKSSYRWSLADDGDLSTMVSRI